MAIFSQDLDNQSAQTKKFLGLVDETAANNKNLVSITDNIMSSLKGQTANAFYNHQLEIHQVAEKNRQTLEGITTSLHQGISMVEQQEQQGASYFQNLDVGGGSAIAAGA